jgi:hypothetical protein
MRNKYSNDLNNIWKKINNKQKNATNDKVLQSVSTESRRGKAIRNGTLEFGAIQLIKPLNSDVLRMGGEGGTVGQ